MLSRIQVPVIDILLFQCGEQHFGVPCESVSEVLRAVALTPIPDAPAGVLGAVNLRGTIVPVLSMRELLGLPLATLSHRHHFVVVGDAPRLALHVDRALTLESEWEPETVDSSSHRNLKESSLRSERVEKLCQTQFGLVPLLRVDKLLKPRELEWLRSIVSSDHLRGVWD